MTRQRAIRMMLSYIKGATCTFTHFQEGMPASLFPGYLVTKEMVWSLPCLLSQKANAVDQVTVVLKGLAVRMLVIVWSWAQGSAGLLSRVRIMLFKEKVMLG